LIAFLGRWRNIVKATTDRSGMLFTILGSFFGPFLGVSLSLISVKYTEAGIAATIMALVPVFIILPAVVLYKQKVTWAEIAGAFLSVGGVALFFI